MSSSHTLILIQPLTLLKKIHSNDNKTAKQSGQIQKFNTPLYFVYIRSPPFSILVEEKSFAFLLFEPNF